MGHNLSHIFKSFQKIVEQQPSAIALYHFSGELISPISYSETLIRAVKFGNILKAAGIQPGDKVALALENQPEYVYALMGVFYADGVCVPLDCQLPPQQLAQLCLHSGAKVLVTFGKFYAKVKECLPDIATKVIDSDEFHREFAGADSDDYFSPDESPDKLAALFYTSGTTDLPKAVMLSHENLLSNVSAINGLNLVGPADRVVSLLPLHHTYAFTTTLLMPLVSGAAIVYPKSLSSVDLVGCMQATQATVFIGVPLVYSMMSRAIQKRLNALPKFAQYFLSPLSTVFHALRRKSGVNLSRFLYAEIHQNMGGALRYLVSGGAKLDEDVAALFERWGFTILEGYGLTETSPVVAFNPPARIKIGSVGKPLVGVEVKIIAPDDKGVGEVTVRGPNVMRGYYQLPQMTAEVLREGWFYTGDLGFLDEEGYLILVGRKKELLVLSSGKKVAPDEVENHYGQIPFIKEIAVLTTSAGSNDGTSEQLVAIVFADDEHFRLHNESNMRERLKWELDNLSFKLPPYKRIHGFVISKEPLPRTRLGKIMRYQLDGIYRSLLASHKQRLADAPADPDEERFTDVSRYALRYVSEALHKDVGMKDHLELDLGLDSLGRIELLLNLQDKLHLELSDDNAMGFFMCSTIEELLKKLKEAMPVSPKEPMAEKESLWPKLLAEPLQTVTQEKINVAPGLLARIFCVVMIAILKVITRVLFQLRVEGRQNLDEKGPYLICPNHTSYLDGIFILCALPFKVALATYFVGYSKVFESFILKPMVRVARLIPLEVSFNLVEALKAVAYVLRHNKMVCYFPEGQRSIDGELKEFKKGVGILLKELNVPVVPVYLSGAYQTWNRTQRFPHLAPVKVIFGKKMLYSELLAGGRVVDDNNAYKVIAHNLQEKVADLNTRVN